MNQIIHRLIDIAMETPKPLDVFVEYMGHVQGVCVRIVKDGTYEAGSANHWIYSERVYLDEEDAMQQLERIEMQVLSILNAEMAA